MFVGSLHCPAQKASAENPLCLSSIIFQTIKEALPSPDSSRKKIPRTAFGKNALPRRTAERANSYGVRIVLVSVTCSSGGSC